MPIDRKKRTEKASCSGSEFSAARWLSCDSGKDDAGEEGAEREGDPERSRRAERDAERQRQHGEGEELARAGTRHLDQDPRHDTRPDQRRQQREAADLGEA